METSRVCTRNYENGDKYKGNLLLVKETELVSTHGKMKYFTYYWKDGVTNGIGKYKWVKENATYEGPLKKDNCKVLKLEATIESPGKESK